MPANVARRAPRVTLAPKVTLVQRATLARRVTPGLRDRPDLQDRQGLPPRDRNRKLEKTPGEPLAGSLGFPDQHFPSMIAFRRCGVTGSCVIAPGIPMASSIAVAMTAPTALTPLSPAPLIPSGLSGDG